jgi:hypothetical protein
VTLLDPAASNIYSCCNGVGHLDSIEFAAPHVSVSQVRVRQVDVQQHCLAEVRLAKIGAPQIGAMKTCVLHTTIVDSSTHAANALEVFDLFIEWLSYFHEHTPRCPVPDRDAHLH